MKVNNRFVHFLSLFIAISLPPANADSPHEMDEKVREAVVAELTRVQQEQLDDSLKQVEQQQAATAAEKQNQLQQMLKLTVAKAVIDNAPDKAAQIEKNKPATVTTSSTEKGSPEKPEVKLARKDPPVTKEIKKEQSQPNKTVHKPTEKAETKEQPKKEQPKAVETSLTKTVSKATPDSSEKWIYLGQYKAGSWEEKTLHIKNDALPKTGTSYTLNQSVNVRDGLPAKKQMPKVVNFLASNDKINLLALKKSGKNGHYWGKISY